MDNVRAAHRQVSLGQTAAAAATLSQAAANGDTDAAHELGIWYLAGDKITRNLPLALQYLMIATDQGSAAAAHLAVALTANGSAAAPDWREAVRLLERLAQSDPVAAQQLKLIAKMDLDQSGHPALPVANEQLNALPGIFLARAFCSQAECDHIAKSAEHLLQPATVFDPATNKQIAHPIRTSDNGTLGPLQETLVVQAVNRRIAKATGTEFTQGEPLTVLRYRVGQQYRPHLDALPQTINQRAKTAILYLNDDYSGGETEFPLLGLKIVPRAGDLLIFDNLDADGSAAMMSRHAGLPITKGEKWIATRWIRSTPYNPWTDYGK